MIGAAGRLLRKYRDKLHHRAARRRRRRIDRDRERRRSLAFLAERFGGDPEAVLEEYRESAFRARFRRDLAALEHTSGTSSEFDCETLYLLVRLARPEIVVETGVLFGAFSAHVLQALEANGAGRLYSVDLPNDAPAQRGQGQDALVPAGLEGRWELVLGDAREELPPLLGGLGGVDLFLHDSDHRFEHQMWEYETAMGHLQPGGVIASHDVLSTLWQRSAFPAFCRRRGLAWATFYNFGVALDDRA